MLRVPSGINLKILCNIKKPPFWVAFSLFILFLAAPHFGFYRLAEFRGGKSAQGKKVLDLGCGSGILGIGARVLGCGYVCGCDIDPKAPDVALSNAALNGIDGSDFKIYAGDILSDAGLRRELGSEYDIVMANIVSDVIIPLSAFAGSFMKRDGIFITSGIIEGRQDEVQAAIEKAGFEIVKHHCQEEWHCFECRLA